MKIRIDKALQIAIPTCRVSQLNGNKILREVAIEFILPAKVYKVKHIDSEGDVVIFYNGLTLHIPKIFTVEIADNE